LEPRPRVQLKTKFGLGLVALGMAVAVAWNMWARTRNLVPVDLPVSLAAEQSVTSNFTLNFDGLYLIQIEAQPTVPPDQLHCLLGVDADPVECGSTQPVLGANWVLSSTGQEIRRGSAEEQHSALPGNSVSREIGEFHGEAGHSYTLLITFTRDGSVLNAAHPHLKVAISGIARSDIEAASVLAVSASFICIMFGLILLAIALYASVKSTTF
jgi:hypothetical protein